MAMNLESREGALRRLGEEFPNEKLEEIRTELMDDAKSDGALNMLKSQINAAIVALTGILPDGSGEQQMGPDGQPMAPQMTPAAAMFEQQSMAQLQNDLVTKAYGTKIPQRRGPDADE
jgi:hypothetical protein